MTTGVSVEVDDAGRPLVCRSAQGEEGRAHLRRLAARLHAAQHPGVVELVGLHEGDDATTLQLGFVAGPTLAEAATLAPDRLARVAAAIASTLADLHARGIVHGRVRPDHVLLSGQQPVLCGFAPPEDLPPAGSADDVAALGRLVLGLLPAAPRAAEQRTVAALQAAASQACADDPSRRPTAAAAAAAFDRVVSDPGSAPTPAGVGTPTPARRPTPRGRARAILVVAGAGTLCLGTALALVAGGTARHGVEPAGPLRTEPSATRPDPTTAAPPPEPAEAQPASPTSSPVPTRLWPTEDPCAAVALPGPDADGDGCADQITVDGRLVAVGLRQFLVGAEGDRVAVGDWDCDGLATAAVLRPGTGEVFVFRDWPDGEPTSTTSATVVAGAADLRGEATPGGCAGLLVRLADGTDTVIPPPAAGGP